MNEVFQGLAKVNALGTRTIFTFLCRFDSDYRFFWREREKGKCHLCTLLLNGDSGGVVW